MALGAHGLHMRGSGLRGGTALRFQFLPGFRFFLRAARLFGLLLLARLVFDAPAVLRLHALALATRGFLAFALGGFSGLDFLALQVGVVLVLLVLLLEDIALDVGLLVAHLDVHGACTSLRARLLELALGLARQRDLARRRGTRGLAGGFGDAVRPPQVGEQLELGLVADQRLGAGDLNARG